MTNPFLVIALVALGMGLIGGAIIVLLIQLRRRREVVDSLTSSDQLLGMIGVVEVPFDRTSRGKIRVTLKGSMMELSALTDDSRTLLKGARVLITEVNNGRVWVVSAEVLDR